MHTIKPDAARTTAGARRKVAMRTHLPIRCQELSIGPYEPAYCSWQAFGSSRADLGT
jgi:hypothetical protein